MALIEITNNIRRLLDEKNYVIVIFIDFKKAFDTPEYVLRLSTVTWGNQDQHMIF